jgi:D-alanine-D-alanine ligase
LIRSVEQLSLTDLVEPPVVVKPNLQGSSIGIGQQSLCHDIVQAKTLAASLLARFAEPVLVEKFIEGLEITVAIWGRGRDILLFQAVEIYEPTGRINFKKTIWSYELKKQLNRLPKAQRSAALSTRDEAALRDLFVAMGKLELVRIDGRLTPEGFYFLEMNPEPYLGSIGSVAKAFALHGWDYEEMFYRLLSPFDV